MEAVTSDHKSTIYLSEKHQLVDVEGPITNSHEVPDAYPMAKGVIVDGSSGHDVGCELRKRRRQRKMLWSRPIRTWCVGYKRGLTTENPPLIRGGETAEEETRDEAQREDESGCVGLKPTAWFGLLSRSGSEQQAETGQHGDAVHLDHVQLLLMHFALNMRARSHAPPCGHQRGDKTITQTAHWTSKDRNVMLLHFFAGNNHTENKD